MSSPVSPKRRDRVADLNFLRDVVAPAGRGDLETVRALVADEPRWVTLHGSHGRTMLWEAAYRGKLAVVEFLVEAGAELEAFGCHYTPHLVDISPYCVARYHGRDEVSAYLASVGAERSVHTCAYLGDVDLLEQLIEGDARLLESGHPQTAFEHDKVWPKYHYYRVEEWATPLVYAVAGASVKTATMLIEAGADAAAVRERLIRFADSRRDRVPEIADVVASALGEPLPSLFSDRLEPGELVYLCRGDRGGNPGEVQRLLEAGADVNERNKRGQTALHNAARAGLIPAMEVLLAHAADVNAVDALGQTPLHAVVRSKIRRRERAHAAFALLLERGADPTVSDHGGATAAAAIATAPAPDRAVFARLLERGST